jgi:hypothetical protein
MMARIGMDMPVDALPRYQEKASERDLHGVRTMWYVFREPINEIREGDDGLLLYLHDAKWLFPSFFGRDKIRPLDERQAVLTFARCPFIIAPTRTDGPPTVSIPAST